MTELGMDEVHEIVCSSGAKLMWHPRRPLVRGGFGFVYEATAADGQALALKRVPLAGPNTERWYMEARLAERELDVAQRARTDFGQTRSAGA